jgi:hypothetical protein
VTGRRPGLTPDTALTAGMLALFGRTRKTTDLLPTLRAADATTTAPEDS